MSGMQKILKHIEKDSEQRYPNDLSLQHSWQLGTLQSVCQTMWARMDDRDREWVMDVCLDKTRV